MVEWLRTPVIQGRKKRRRVRLDTTEGCNGGAERTAWELLSEMAKYNENEEETDQGAVTLVLDLSKAPQKVQFEVAWAWVSGSATYPQSRSSRLEMVSLAFETYVGGRNE